MQLKLGYQPTETPETIEHFSPEPEDSGDDSSVVDVPNAQQPWHLRSLFQNDWLSVDTHLQNEYLQDRNAKASAHLLHIAKPALQKLIPSKDEFLSFATSSSSSSEWLILLHHLLPQPFTIKSQQEFLESYDALNKPDVSTLDLATWLLTVAITAQQDPCASDSPEDQVTRYTRCLGFSRAVSDTVESTIITHDRLIGTVQGLGMSVHFVRLSVSCISVST